jgi:hypothetical protein
MSASGNVVVYTEFGTDPHRACRLLTSTGTTSCSDLLSSAGGVSTDGAVVFGGLVADASRDGVWSTQSGDVQIPPYPSDWTSGRIHAISYDGTVFVGRGVRMMGENAELHPFISQNGIFQEIAVPTGNLSDVSPEDISSNGTRFIGHAVNSATNTTEAVFWDEADGLRTLFDELTARGLEFPVDVSEIAAGYFISSDGRTLVGQGATGLGPFWRVELLD